MRFSQKHLCPVTYLHVFSCVLVWLYTSPTSPLHAEATPIVYEFSLELTDAPELLEKFNQTSLLKTLQDRPLYSRFALQKRIENDKQLLQKLFESFGYFEAELEVSIEDAHDTTKIVFIPSLGPRYKVGDVSFRFTPPPPKEPTCEVSRAFSSVAKHRPINAEKILARFERITQQFGECGYPFARLVNHHALLDKANKTVHMRVYIDLGPYVVFGPLEIEDPDQVVSHGFIQNRLPWREGDEFDTRLVTKFREKLTKTRLFQSISLPRDRKDLDQGKLPVKLKISKAKPRTLSAGVNFSTSFGAGGGTEWVHRNLTGYADTFRVSASYMEKRSQGGIDYELPDFLWVNQTLGLSIEARDEETEAYDRFFYGASAGLRYEFYENWYFLYGVFYDSSRIKDNGKTSNTDVVGIPLGFEIDTRDDLWNPTKGGQYYVQTSPEWGNVGKSDSLLRSSLFATHNIGFGRDARFILSGWGRVSTISGASLSDVPLDRRIYLGGGGSIRGYKYQLAGPLDQSQDPIGGRGALEFGVEPRIRFDDTWGMAVFYDGGILSETSAPKFSDKYFHSIGLGGRYFTDFGPLRFDVAFPLKVRRELGGKRIDDAFQIYVSIGQAF